MTLIPVYTQLAIIFAPCDRLRAHVSDLWVKAPGSLTLKRLTGLRLLIRNLHNELVHLSAIMSKLPFAAIRSPFFVAPDNASDQDVLIPEQYTEKAAPQETKEPSLLQSLRRSGSVLGTRRKANDAARSGSKEDKRRSLVIDSYLASEWQKRLDNPRVILFGHGDQIAKVWKSLQLLARPLTDAELSELKLEIQKQVLEQARISLLESLDKAEQNLPKDKSPVPEDPYKSQLIRQALDIKCEDATKARNLILLHRSGVLESPPVAVDPGVREAHGPMKTEKLDKMVNTRWNSTDSTLIQIETVFNSDFQPIESDWIRVHPSRLLPVFVQEIKLHGAQKLVTFLNLRGGGGERRKWVHLFDDVQYCLFPLDPSIYDETLFEDCETTLLSESLCLFDSVRNSRYFCNCHILIVFYDISSFRKKLQVSPFASWYPDCEASDADGILDYLFQRYKNTSRSESSINCIKIEDLNPESMDGVVKFIEQEERSLREGK